MEFENRVNSILSNISSVFAENKICAESQILSLIENKTLQSNPRNRDELLKRIRTYASLTWFAKPDWLSPVHCARLGWINVDADLIECVSCKAVVSGKLPSSVNLSIYEECCRRLKSHLVNSHHACCPWKSNPTSFDLCRLMLKSRSEEMPCFVDQVQGFLRLSRQLPIIGESALESLKLTEFQLMCLCQLVVDQLPSCAGADAPLLLSACTLSLCGWHVLGSSHSTVVTCEFCDRKFGLWNCFSQVFEGDREDSSTDSEVGASEDMEVIEKHLETDSNVETQEICLQDENGTVSKVKLKSTPDRIVAGLDYQSRVGVIENDAVPESHEQCKDSGLVPISLPFKIEDDANKLWTIDATDFKCATESEDHLVSDVASFKADDEKTDNFSAGVVLLAGNKPAERISNSLSENNPPENIVEHDRIRSAALRDHEHYTRDEREHKTLDDLSGNCLDTPRVSTGNIADSLESVATSSFMEEVPTNLELWSDYSISNISADDGMWVTSDLCTTGFGHVAVDGEVERCQEGRFEHDPVSVEDLNFMVEIESTEIVDGDGKDLAQAEFCDNVTGADGPNTDLRGSSLQVPDVLVPLDAGMGEGNSEVTNVNSKEQGNSVQTDESLELAHSIANPATKFTGKTTDQSAEFIGTTTDQSETVTENETDQSAEFAGNAIDQSAEFTGITTDQSETVTENETGQSAEFAGSTTDQSAEVLSDASKIEESAERKDGEPQECEETPNSLNSSKRLLPTADSEELASSVKKRRRLAKPSRMHFNPVTQHQPWCIWVRDLAAEETRQLVRRSRDAEEPTTYEPPWIRFFQLLLRASGADENRQTSKKLQTVWSVIKGF